MFKAAVCLLLVLIITVRSDNSSKLRVSIHIKYIIDTLQTTIYKTLFIFFII